MRTEAHDGVEAYAELPDGRKVWSVGRFGDGVRADVGASPDATENVLLIDSNHRWQVEWTAPVRSKLEAVLAQEGMPPRGSPFEVAQSILHHMQEGRLAIHDAQRVIEQFNADRERSVGSDVMDPVKDIGFVLVGAPAKYEIRVWIGQSSGHIGMSVRELGTRTSSTLL